MPQQISVQEAIRQALQRDTVFIDTRAPKEFAEDHLPNAVNLPILSNEERAVVGTLYKKDSQEKAVEKGLEFFSQKLPCFMKEINKYSEHKKKQLIINCWQGGMRSGTIVALLESIGYNALQLQGGYKAFRKYVRERLENYHLKAKLIVLHGLTSTGKTKILAAFPNSLNLEELAQHRSSLYGAIGLQPRSQKLFENLLLQRLDELKGETGNIFIEGESRRIGDVIIPSFLWKAMNEGIKVAVWRSMEKRIVAAVEEYCNTSEKVQEAKKITKSLFKVISKKKKQEMLNLLEKEDHHGAVRILLENYYDPLYVHTLKRLKYAFEINTDDLERAVRELKRNVGTL